MLKAVSKRDIMGPCHGYSLGNIQIDLSDPMTATFKATLNGPEDQPVWVRAWLSTEAGTLAEEASPQLKTGDEITLKVILQTSESPQYAYMRIESAPLKTEHVVALRLG